MGEFHLSCSECGIEYGEDPALLVCPVCSGHQEPGGSTRGVLEVVLESLPDAWPVERPSDPRFLAAFLPVEGPESFPPFPAGDTPLVPAPRLAARLGLDHLWIKDDTRNPSGSTKDRASLLVAAKAREYGLGTIAAASTGNAGTALAAVGAAAGLETVVFVPAAAPEAKLVQNALVRRAGGAGERQLRQCVRTLPRGVPGIRLVQSEYRPQPLHDRRQEDRRPGDRAFSGRSPARTWWWCPWATA